MPADFLVTPGLNECHCANLRSGSRKLSQLYDAVLAPANVRLTQFTILRCLNYADMSAPTIVKLAAVLEVDRTTLGRNLGVLERDGLISIDLDSADHRSRRVRLLAKGKARFRLALPYWQKAQSLFERSVDKQRIHDMYSALLAIRRADFG